jgi:hypothetical protein
MAWLGGVVVGCAGLAAVDASVAMLCRDGREKALPATQLAPRARARSAARGCQLPASGGRAASVQPGARTPKFDV